MEAEVLGGLVGLERFLRGVGDGLGGPDIEGSELEAVAVTSAAAASG